MLEACRAIRRKREDLEAGWKVVNVRLEVRFQLDYYCSQMQQSLHTRRWCHCSRFLQSLSNAMVAIEILPRTWFCYGDDGSLQTVVEVGGRMSLSVLVVSRMDSI